MMFPNAVHHDTGGQRIFPTRYSFPKLQPAAAFVHCSLLLASNDLQKAPRSDFAEILVIPANMHSYVMRVLIGPSHREDRQWNPPLQLFTSSLQVSQLLEGRTVAS